MTYKEREEIFAKDYLTIDDVGRLLGMEYSTAAKTIREIKRRHDRLHIKGKIHVQDYLDYYGIDNQARYKNYDDEKPKTCVTGQDEKPLAREIRSLF